MDKMERIRNNRNYLNLLCTSKKRLREVLISNASNDQINSIREIILNILNGNLKIDNESFKKLEKKKKLLRELVKKSGGLKNRKRIIQKGGFLSFIIPAIITGLASVASSLIEKL